MPGVVPPSRDGGNALLCKTAGNALETSYSQPGVATLHGESISESPSRAR